MTTADFRERLAERASRAGLELKSEELAPLEQYFRLLLTWNRTINLTSLPLDPPTNESLDRLLVEPLAAAGFLRAHLPYGPQSAGPQSAGPQSAGPQSAGPQSAIRNPQWFDLGSGGGSPAIPLKIAIPALELTMIESKSRKAAFLREATRVLNLRGAAVLNARVEDVVKREAIADLVTVRAVRTDAALEALTAELLRDEGWLVAFRTTAEQAAAPDSFRQLEVVNVGVERPTYLHIFARVPRGTNH